MEEQHKKPLSWHVYVAALAATALVFLIGAGVGWTAASWRASYVQNRLTSLFINMLSYTEIANVQNPCDTSQYVWIMGGELDKIGERLSQGDYPPYLLNYYVLLEYKHAELIRRIKEECNRPVNWIFYFYGPQCSQCDAQANVLSAVKRLAQKKIFIYSFRTNLDSPIIQLLKAKYDVNTVPMLVVNGHVLRGLQSAAEIEKYLDLNNAVSGS